MSTVSSVAAPAIFSSPPSQSGCHTKFTHLPGDIVGRKRARSERKLWPSERSRAIGPGLFRLVPRLAALVEQLALRATVSHQSATSCDFKSPHGPRSMSSTQARFASMNLLYAKKLLQFS